MMQKKKKKEIIKKKWKTLRISSVAYILLPVVVVSLDQVCIVPILSNVKIVTRLARLT